MANGGQAQQPIFAPHPPRLFADARTRLTSEFWNRVIGDLDNRVTESETRGEELENVYQDVQSIALQRINSVLTPTLELLSDIAEKGFMIAHSASERTLQLGTTVSFFIDDVQEAELFTPTGYVSITRDATPDDYAIARTVQYQEDNQLYYGEIISIVGNPGPHHDWVIGATAAFLPAMVDVEANVAALRDETQILADEVQTNRDYVEATITAIGEGGAGVVSVNGKVGLVILVPSDIGAMSAVAPTAPDIVNNTDATTKVANTNFVQLAVNRVKNDAQQYALGQDQTNLAAAKSYTDVKVGQITEGVPQTYVDTRDNTILALANAHSDDHDQVTLTAAQNYSDAVLNAFTNVPDVGAYVRFHSGSF